jgi:hypothetical protein
MAQQVLPAQTDQNVTLDRRLLELDDVDRKIADLMETTKEIISNLEKDKQVLSYFLIINILFLDIQDKDGRYREEVYSHTRRGHFPRRQ